MHGGAFAVYGECPAHGDAFIGGVIHEKPQIMFVCPPAKEGFFVPCKTTVSCRAIAYLYHQKDAIPLSILFIFFLF